MTVKMLGRSTRSADIYRNPELVEHMRNRGKFFDFDAKRERDLIRRDHRETPALFVSQ